MQNTDHFNQNTEHLNPTRFQILLPDFFSPENGTGCTTKGGLPCLFPYTRNGKTVTGCIILQSKNNRANKILTNIQVACNTNDE
jgi:hypothetical protein